MEGVSIQQKGSLSRGRGPCPGEGASVQGKGSLSRGRVSVQGKWSLSWERGLCPGEGVCVQGGLCPEGVSVQGSLCLEVDREPPQPYEYVRAVCILRECILVFSCAIFGVFFQNPSR